MNKVAGFEGLRYLFLVFEVNRELSRLLSAEQWPPKTQTLKSYSSLFSGYLSGILNDPGGTFFRSHTVDTDK